MRARGLTYLSFLLLFAACKKGDSFDCFRSNGPQTTEIRYPGNFTKVLLDDKIDVTISKGSACKVEVIAGEHIIKNISTEIENGVLRIRNKNTCNVVRGYKRHIQVNITLPYLASVLDNGEAGIHINDGFEQDTIRVRAESSGDIHLSGSFDYLGAFSNGNGDLYLSGSCKTLDVYINGTNFLEAQGLSISDYAFIETLTNGDCHLNGTSLQKLEYALYKSGNIYYTGSPVSIEGTYANDARGRVMKEN